MATPENTSGARKDLHKDPDATKVRAWRHHMQKTFLSQPEIKSEDMTFADTVLGSIERYEGMTEEYLAYSKIRKIIRRIQDLPASQIPREDEYHFRDRARKLVNKWDAISKASSNSSSGYAQDDIPAASLSSATEHADSSASRAVTATVAPATEASNSIPAPSTGSTRPLPTPPTASATTAPTAKPLPSSQIHVPEYRKESLPRLPSALDHDPEAQKVRNWRHVLQKKFFTPGRNFDVKDAVACAMLFTTIEQYEGMTAEFLTYSKIPKVMRHIYLLSTEQIPGDDEFQFRERAKELCDRWADPSFPKEPPPTSRAATSPPACDARESAPSPNPPLCEDSIAASVEAAEIPSEQGGTTRSEAVTAGTEAVAHEDDGPTFGDKGPLANSEGWSQNVVDSTQSLPIAEPSPSLDVVKSQDVDVAAETTASVPDTCESGDLVNAPSDTDVSPFEVDLDDDVSEEFFDAEPPRAAEATTAEEEEAWVLVDMVMESVRVM